MLALALSAIAFSLASLAHDRFGSLVRIRLETGDDLARHLAPNQSFDIQQQRLIVGAHQ